MAADEKAKIIVDGDVSPLRQKLREGARDLKSFGDQGKASIEGIGGPLKALQQKFIAIGALLAGGAVFKAAVNEAAKFTEESMKLGNALGISATEASTLVNALEDIDVSQQEFTTAAKALAKEIRNNESALQAMGLQTRDAAGELRPLSELMIEAVGVLNSYKSGTDRAIAGQVLFGKGFDINSNLARLNSDTLRENAELQKRLGAIVGQENVEAWKDYDQAMDQSHITLKALKTTIGNAVMPVLTKLGEWFVAAGPYVMRFTKLVMETFLGIVDVLRIVKQAFVSVGSDIGAVFAAAASALRGDFAGAATILRERMADAAKETQRLKDLWMGTGDSFLGKYRAQASATPAPASTGGKSAADLIKPDKDKKTKTTKPQFTDAEWANLEAEHLQKTLDELQRIELEYQEARAAAQQKADEKLLQEMDGIYLLRVGAARDAAMDRIDAAENAARHELDLNNITQAEYLVRLEQFNQQRLAAEERFIEAKKQIALEDPDKNVVALEQIEIQKEEIRRRYAEQALEIQRQQALEAQNIFRQISDSMSSLWDKMISSIMQGTFTWRNLLQAVFAEIAGIFGGMVKNMVMKWIQNQIQMLVFGKTTAMSEIMTLAGKAGAGGVASMAAAPFPLNTTAPAFGAQMSAAAMAYAPAVSAAGGYDIPPGLNPVAQLHQEEMVLPATLANAIRDMVGNTAASDGSSTRIVNLFDPSQVAGELGKTREFERAVLNVIQLNPRAVQGEF